MVKTLPVFSPIPPPKKEPAHNFHPIQEYDPDGRQDVLDGMALTLAEYVGAAGAASVTFGNEPRTSPGARSTSKSKVRFTPGTAGSDGGLLDGEGPVVPDSKALWRMPPPAAFSYDWKFDAPKRVIVHGVDVNTKRETSILTSSETPAATTNREGALPPIDALSPVERKRRKRIERNRRSLRTPWLPSAGHVRRAPIAPNGAYLFPHASSSLLAKSCKRRRDRKLKVELRVAVSVRTPFSRRARPRRARELLSECRGLGSFSWSAARRAPSAGSGAGPPRAPTTRGPHGGPRRVRGLGAREHFLEECRRPPSGHALRGSARPTPLRRRALERDLVADAPKTHTESEHRGRIIGDMLDLREELVRTIASPWVPRMGRCR